MGPAMVRVDQILDQFVGELVEIVEGCTLADVLVEGSPEAVDLAVGLWPIAPSVAVSDAQFEQYGRKWMLVGIAAGCEFGGIVGRISRKTSP